MQDLLTRSYSSVGLERVAVNRKVVGSIPTWTAILFFHRVLLSEKNIFLLEMAAAAEVNARSEYEKAFNALLTEGPVLKNNASEENQEKYEEDRKEFRAMVKGTLAGQKFRNYSGLQANGTPIPKAEVDAHFANLNRMPRATNAILRGIQEGIQQRLINEKMKLAVNVSKLRKGSRKSRKNRKGSRKNRKSRRV